MPTIVTPAAKQLSRRPQAWLTFNVRQNMKLLTILILTLFLMHNAHCAGISFVASSVENRSSDDANTAALVGAWHCRYRAKGNSITEHIIHRAADGTYTLRCRVLQKNEVVWLSTEFGVWGVHNGLEVSQAKKIQFTDGITKMISDDRLEIHEIVAVTPTRYTYRFYGEHLDLAADKVSDDFDFDQKPNQALLPTPTSVTPPAAQEPRQP